MNTLAAITADDIHAYQELALVAIGAIVVVGTAAIGAAFTLVYLVKSRMDALHGTQLTMQQALNDVQQSLPSASAQSPVQVSGKSFAQALVESAPHLAAAIAAANAPKNNWPSASPTLPPKVP